MQWLSRIRHYWDQSQKVRTETGTSPWRQFVEIARLSFGVGRIGPGDYYTYRLFDPRLSWQEKQRFVGWRAEGLLDGLNEGSWHGLGLDKVLMYAQLGNGGIPVPETTAVYLPGRGRLLDGAADLTSEEALVDWLRNPANYPFFSKPSASGFGRAAYWARTYDDAEDAIVFEDGTRTPVAAFPPLMVDRERLGYLFQRPLEPDPRLVPLLGAIVSSLRVMVLIDEVGGPVIHRTFWKLPTLGNMCDNFNSGVTGNLAAAIDFQSGRIIRAIASIDLERAEATHHPDTGALLSSISVPDWPAVQAFVCRAAVVFPKLRFQQWDVALTDRGPVMLEVNLFGTGGCDLTQILYRKGLLDEVMRGFLARHSPGMRAL